MINIELTSEAQAAVDHACQAAGMKKRELVARVLRWFSIQDDEIRALVLGQIPKSIAPLVAKHLLESMTGVDSLVAHVDTSAVATPSASVKKPVKKEEKAKT